MKQHPTIQLHTTSILAAKFHGRLYMEFAFRRGEE